MRAIVAGAALAAVVACAGVTGAERAEAALIHIVANGTGNINNVLYVDAYADTYRGIVTGTTTYIDDFFPPPGVPQNTTTEFFISPFPTMAVLNDVVLVYLGGFGAYIGYFNDGDNIPDYGYLQSFYGGDFSITSYVPLPATAPMFGAALMAFGAAGYVLKRRSRPSAA